MGRRAKRTSIFFDSELIGKFSDRIQSLLDTVQEEIPDLLVSEFAEQNRVLPPGGTPYPGPWRNWRAPYLVEIMDNLAARSKVEETIWIKPSQVGATSAAENFVGYVIKCVPGPMLYMTAKEEMVRKWVAKRFNPMIQSCGLEELIFKQHALAGGRATGNQMFSKEFPGGFFDLASAQSEANYRMDTIRYLILDEAGTYPASIQGYGDPIAVARARTANWGSRRRVLIPSTPGLDGECRMWSLYQEGDQRRFFVPCLSCGEGMVLKFPSEPVAFYESLPAADIRWETAAGLLDPSTIHVQCPHCSERIGEDKRYQLIQGGQWRPTAEAKRPRVRSYQMGRLCALLGSWRELVEQEIAALQDPLKLQAHHNQNCGIPYRAATQSPERTKIYQLRGYYQSGEIPSDSVLFLTAATDVQSGVSSDPDRPARLETEICAHGLGYRTWSILHKIFVGAVDDPFSGAWEDYYTWMLGGGMQCRRSDGMVFAPNLIFVDSGDGSTEGAVFDFCARLHGALPVKGAAELKRTAQGRRAEHVLDERGPRDRDRFREHRKNDQVFVMILTNWYKNLLWRSLQIPRQEVGEQRPRFCEFPKDYPDSYFDQLVSEERRDDGTFWLPRGRANEALDLRIYNMAACDYWLYLETRRIKREMIRKGYSQDEADYTRSRHVLDMYAQRVARRPTGG